MLPVNQQELLKQGTGLSLCVSRVDTITCNYVSLMGGQKTCKCVIEIHSLFFISGILT